MQMLSLTTVMAVIMRGMTLSKMRSLSVCSVSSPLVPTGQGRHQMQQCALNTMLLFGQPIDSTAALTGSLMQISA